MNETNGQTNINLTQAEFKGRVLQTLEDIKENISEVKENLEAKVSTKTFDREVASLKKKTEQNFAQINVLSKRIENYTQLHKEQEQLRAALKEQKDAQKEFEKRIIRFVVVTIIAGSFFWVKESREIIISFISTLFF